MKLYRIPCQYLFIFNYQFNTYMYMLINKVLTLMAEWYIYNYIPWSIDQSTQSVKGYRFDTMQLRSVLRFYKIVICYFIV